MEQYDAQRPQSLDVVLDYLGITEDEFNGMAENHMIYPHLHDPSKIRRSQFKLADHDWYADRMGRIAKAGPIKNANVQKNTTDGE